MQLYPGPMILIQQYFAEFLQPLNRLDPFAINLQFILPQVQKGRPVWLHYI